MIKSYQMTVYLTDRLYSLCSDIEDSSRCLKSAKASGLDDLCMENILYAQHAVIVHLKILFNLICKHGFIPDAFGQSVTVPVIKDW